MFSMLKGFHLVIIFDDSQSVVILHCLLSIESHYVLLESTIRKLPYLSSNHDVAVDVEGCTVVVLGADGDA